MKKRVVGWCVKDTKDGSYYGPMGWGKALAYYGTKGAAEAQRNRFLPWVRDCIVIRPVVRRPKKKPDPVWKKLDEIAHGLVRVHEQIESNARGHIPLSDALSDQMRGCLGVRVRKERA